MDFDLLGPLPTGTTVLEASAGTGKTYANRRTRDPFVLPKVSPTYRKFCW